MRAAPAYADVVAPKWVPFDDRLARSARLASAASKSCLDPGPVWKTREHNLQLLAQLDSFKKWDRPLMLARPANRLSDSSPATWMPRNGCPAHWRARAGVRESEQPHARA
jgi:hypothetical protein